MRAHRQHLQKWIKISVLEGRGFWEVVVRRSRPNRFSDRLLHNTLHLLIMLGSCFPPIEVKDLGKELRCECTEHTVSKVDAARMAHT